MKKLSTPCMNSIDYDDPKNPNNRKSEPRKQTLDFLKQFARVYKAEPALKRELCGYVLN